ncbi:hypothetical protein Q0Z83_109870 [Actinoplanes sichuanensis]|nr:hypothetical protein Q0Z83_109870 [Actinoplanes sichuanensis]
MLAALSVPMCAAALMASAPARADYHDTKILSTTINNGRPIVMGASGSATATVPVTVEIYDDSGGVETIDAQLKSVNLSFFDFLEEIPDNDGDNMRCVAKTATTQLCSGTAVIHQYDLHDNSAGQALWLHISGYTMDSEQYVLYGHTAAPVRLFKQTWLTTANATPEPARKGSNLTVTGTLTQPDWSYLLADGSTKMTVGYAGQPVRLQFARAGSTAYTTVKTVTSGAGGALKAAAPANLSGTWRWYFGGSGTSAAAVSGGDAVTLYKVARLTANATPEPVRKGGRLTVTGRLTRATTDAATTFTGYARQPVRLQFRRAGSSTYTTIKTVWTDGYGYLRTTTKATAAGYWRWSYAGNGSVASVSATGDGVALK